MRTARLRSNYWFLQKRMYLRKSFDLSKRFLVLTLCKRMIEAKFNRCTTKSFSESFRKLRGKSMLLGEPQFIKLEIY